MYDVREIADDEHEAIGQLAKELWGDQIMVVHNEIFDLSCFPGFLAEENGKIIGFLTYRQMGHEAVEILSLDSFTENRGIGSALLDAVIHYCARNCVHRLFLTCTNDNFRALEFYQKRGFTLTAFRRGAVNEARKRKPSIPLRSKNGVSIEHELELDYFLPDSV